MHHVPKTRPIIAARRFGVASWPGKPPELEALCRLGDETWHKPGAQRADDAPTLGNTSGLHAYVDIDALHAEEGARLVSQVDGVVALWGTVVEHEDGYRAEYGQVLELLDGPWADTACGCLGCVNARKDGPAMFKQLVATYTPPTA